MLNIGCTSALFFDQNNKPWSVRTFDFPKHIESQGSSYPRNMEYQSSAPDGKKGLAWTSKYGFWGVGGEHLKGIYDGQNEKRLSFAFLTLLCSEYQSVSLEQESQALALMDVGPWILGNFATVDEVKEAIHGVRIWGGDEKILGSIPGLHIILYDAEGKKLVIEFIKGEVFLYENSSVVTNDPPLPEQLENLEKYKHLTPYSSSYDVGSGMLDLPGDDTSSSRFTRIAKAVEYILPAPSDNKALENAQHLLNKVDVIKGMNRFDLNDTLFYEATLLGFVKNLKDNIFYWRSYHDMTWNFVDLKKFTFTVEESKKIYKLQAEKPTVIDRTDYFIKN